MTMHTHLLPGECVGMSTDQLIPSGLATAVDYYKDDLPHHVMFTTEYHQWVRQWEEESAAVPETLVDALGKCNRLAYPNLHALLCLAVTLPITSAESEKSFSQLNLIKTAHRTVMTGSRLTSLALMKINRDRCNELLSDDNMKKLVSRFAQLHPIRLRLPCMFNAMTSSFSSCLFLSLLLVNVIFHKLDSLIFMNVANFMFKKS